MQRFYTLLLFGLLLSPLAYSQMVPKGMKYQAVARNLTGGLMANKPITLQINLTSRQGGVSVVHYSESHSVVTNQLGLFTLTIGEGKAQKASFDKIPWSSEDIWMEVAIKEDGQRDFTAISSSKLLAVPYALHALTANELVNTNRANPAARLAGPDPGVPANVWSQFGNSTVDPDKDKLGSTNYADLVMITNNIERLRITKDGDINIKTNLNVGNDVMIGNDLTVKQDVFLNTVGGATINNGPFTVANNKSTVLTGTLNVNGNTDLDGTLNTDGATTLKSTLSVDGATDLNNTLNVDGNTTLNGLTNSTNVTQSTNITTGAVTVAGGVGIVKNLNVGGNSTFGGILNILDATESTSTTTGALIVAGGVGISKRINVGGAAQLNNTLAVNGATTLNSTLNVTGVATMNSRLDANGQVTINADVNGADGDYSAYPLRVQGSNQGIAIKVDGSRSNTNNFVTFMDDNGIWGRIEGQTTSELENSQEYKTQVAIFVLEGVSLAADIVGLGAEAAALAAAVITAPAAVAVGAQVAAATVQAAELLTESITWSKDVHDNVGVAYESGNGDYAEWLERSKTEKDMIFGQIVGVKGGKLSLQTDKADHVMVISKSPIVLGNMPPAKREKDYEKVALMGQVPVRVVGQVAIGDYIMPSGNHDGFGIAVHPADMKLGDYARIVGVAWQAAKDASLNIVNVAVGINANDLTSKMVAMSQRIDSLSQKTDNIMAYLQGKGPLQTGGSGPSTGVAAGKANGVASTGPAKTTLTKTMTDAEFDRVIDQCTPQLLQYFGDTKQQIMAKGIDVTGNPYLAAFFNDPIASVKQLRRDPTMSTQWGRFDQQLQQKTRK